jgi:predicted nucleic acid-binding protein
VPVIDASLFVDALVVTGGPGVAARAEIEGLSVLQVPAVFGAEVVSALRAMVRRGDVSPSRALAAIEQLRTVRTVQYPFEPFADRVWELGANLTVYDAWYVALAEWLGTELLTADVRLTAAPGPRCRIRLPDDANGV